MPVFETSPGDCSSLSSRTAAVRKSYSREQIRVFISIEGYIGEAPPFLNHNIVNFLFG